jgi:hypothetical protein
LSPDESWLAGQIWADGSLDPVGPAALTWNVTTATSDEQMAIEIGRIIDESPRVYEPRERRKRGYSFYISGAPVQRLVELGLVHRKTRECTLPTLDDGWSARDFIRGFFDGDGSVGLYASPTRRKDGSKRLTSSFCGTREMMLGVMDVLAAATRITPRVPHPSATIWVLKFNHYDSLRLADYMYYPGATCLHRKRDIFDSGRILAPPREGY